MDMEQSEAVSVDADAADMVTAAVLVTGSL